MPITDYYVASDAMGSVTAILDEDGNVIERRSYDAFGEMTCMAPDGTQLTESPTGLDVGFQAQIHDEVTGLYQMGYRWYNPSIGRWLSRDPIGLGGGANTHSAFNNEPSQASDTFGLKLTREECFEAKQSYKAAIERMISSNFSPYPSNCGGNSCCEKITVYLDMGDPCSDVPYLRGKVGHAGIAVGNRFYDWGPTGSSLIGFGGPYLSGEKYNIKPLLSELESQLQYASGGDIVVEVEICVSPNEAEKAEDFWAYLYDLKKHLGISGPYDPFLSNCANASFNSLLAMGNQPEFSERLLRFSPLRTPTSMLG